MGYSNIAGRAVLPVDPIIANRLTGKHSAARSFRLRSSHRKNWYMKQFIPVLIATCIILLPFASSNLSTANAQQGEIAVPDLTGMTLPQAAKLVGEAGLLYQGENTKAWTAGAKVKGNQISDQQPAPGQKAAAGTPGSVTGLRAYNTSLIYDGSSITLKKTSTADLDLSSVTFTSGQGKDLSQFSAFEWGVFTLKPGECDRILAGFKATPAAVDCQKVVRQNVYTEKTKQFWLTNMFTVMRMGESVITCDATAGHCDFYLPQADDTERTTYLNFNYRTNHLVVRNDSDRWMILSNIYVAGRDLKRFTLDTMGNFTAGVGDLGAPHHPP